VPWGARNAGKTIESPVINASEGRNPGKPAVSLVVPWGARNAGKPIESLVMLLRAETLESQQKAQ